MYLSWLIGLIGSLAISGAAYAKRSLTGSGALAAIVLGTLMFVFGSFAWFGTLIAFFVSSTLLTKLKPRSKEAAESRYAKSGNRDAGQVIANGGIGLILCLIHAVWPHPLWWAAFVGVMASVTADTWATEIGGLSRSAPRSILHGRKVSPGTSGGVTMLGLAASAAGGIFVGAAAWSLAQLGAYMSATIQAVQSMAPQWTSDAAVTGGALGSVIIIGMISGLFGSLADSWIGAVWQVMYRCSICGEEVEKSVHCQQPAQKIRGIRWLNNDGVNITASCLGGLAAAMLGLMFI